MPIFRSLGQRADTHRAYLKIRSLWTVKVTMKTTFNGSTFETKVTALVTKKLGAKF